MKIQCSTMRSNSFGCMPPKAGVEGELAFLVVLLKIKEMRNTQRFPASRTRSRGCGESVPPLPPPPRALSSPPPVCFIPARSLSH